MDVKLKHFSILFTLLNRFLKVMIFTVRLILMREEVIVVIVEQPRGWLSWGDLSEGGPCQGVCKLRSRAKSN